MASINLQSRDGGGDDSSRSPIRSRGVSSTYRKIVMGDSVELSPPVVSVAPPAASPPSFFVQEQIAIPSSDSCPPKVVPETTNSPDDSGTECHPEDSGSGGGGSNAVKKPVWSKPSNGVVEVVSPVMGAVSWPALGKSTKRAPKSSSSESLPALSDRSSLPALPVARNSSSSSQKPATATIVNPSSTPNHVPPSGQRTMRRGGGNSGAYTQSNGAIPQRSPPIQDPKVETPRNTSSKPATFPTDNPTFRESPRLGFGSQPNTGNANDHHHQRNSFRRGNGGQQGSFQGRGNHGNQEWNQHRNFNNRDTNMPPQRGFRRGFIRPSVHPTNPFMSQHIPMQTRPFANNVMFPDFASAMNVVFFPNPTPPDHLRSPMVAPMQPPMFFPVADPNLHSKIVDQIDYYFSDANLVKDIYLRENMDSQGWVSVTLIAGFKKVSCLTDNVQLILDAMRTSKAVEVQGDKLRRRDEWMKWLIPPPAKYLAIQLLGIGLDDVESLSGGGVEGARVA